MKLRQINVASVSSSPAIAAVFGASCNRCSSLALSLDLEQLQAKNVTDNNPVSKNRRIIISSIRDVEKRA